MDGISGSQEGSKVCGELFWRLRGPLKGVHLMQSGGRLVAMGEAKVHIGAGMVCRLGILKVGVLGKAGVRGHLTAPLQLEVSVVGFTRSLHWSSSWVRGVGKG